MVPAQKDKDPPHEGKECARLPDLKLVFQVHFHPNFLQTRLMTDHTDWN